MPSNQAASPVGQRKVSRPKTCSMGSGIHRTVSVKQPMRLPKVLAKIMLRPGLMPSGGQAYRLYKTSYRPYSTLPIPMMIFPSSLFCASSWGVPTVPSGVFLLSV